MAVFRKIEDLITEGLCDSRGGAVCATIVSLPGWKAKLGFVELKRAENFVFKANFWTQLLAFDYEGAHYEFTNFGNHKILKAVFAEEV